MNVSPLLSSTLSVVQLPTMQTAAAVVESTQAIAPTTSSSQGGSTGGSTSQQQKSSSGSSSSTSSVETALQSMNNEMASWSDQMRFTIDPTTHHVVIEIVDPETGKVISTIPSETMQQISKMITKFQGNAVTTSA